MIDRKKLKYIMKDRTNDECAKHLGVSKRTIARWLNSFGLRYQELKHSNFPKEFSQEQTNFLTASMLGDGSIDKQGRFKLKMKSDKKEYVDWSRQLLSPMSRKLQNEDGVRNGIITKSTYFCTSNYLLFKDLRSVWYPSDYKKVPENIEINQMTLSHWFIQNGCNIWQKKNAQFITHCFDANSVDLLVCKINKIGFRSTIQKNKKGKFTINIGAREYFEFIEFINKHNCFDCFSYKFDTSKCKKNILNGGAYKLNFQKAEQIRNIYKNLNCTQKYLAEKFNVTQSAIGKVLNNISYQRESNGFKK